MTNNYAEINKRKMDKCKKCFEELEYLLTASYESVGSCNKDSSMYLCPKGTLHQISYYSKPMNSFRISNHWNWYSNLKKCKDAEYIQCFSVDIPMPKDRINPGKASRPRFGTQVAFFGDDNKYHCIYGDKYDSQTEEWSWVESNPEEVMSELLR